jgi:hypothetical protein
MRKNIERREGGRYVKQRLKDVTKGKLNLGSHERAGWINYKF